MKSQAVVNFSSKPGSVELQEIEYPRFGDDDVIMQVEAVSVCGSDLHQWHGTNSWEVNYPVVLGHEFCGVIKELGQNNIFFSNSFVVFHIFFGHKSQIGSNFLEYNINRSLIINGTGHQSSTHLIHKWLGHQFTTDFVHLGNSEFKIGCF